MKKQPTKKPNKAEQTRVKDLEPKQNPKAGAWKPPTPGINVKFTLFNPDGTPRGSS